MIALTVAAVLIIVVTAGVLRRRLYRRSFSLPPRRHDTINCRNSKDAIAVRAEADGICVPDNLQPRGQTALLQLTVNATLTGHWVDPFIEIQDEQHVYRQYFERGAAGQRYLNLSPVFQRSDRNSLSKILLRGRSIRWEPAAVLLLFESPSLENAAVLVLAPHPDDAEIAAFGMYAAHRSWVVTITAGERATGNLAAIVPDNRRAHWAAVTRVWDSLSIPHFGEVPPGRRVNLVCPDGLLESMYKEPTRPFRLACEETLPRRRLRSANHLPEFQQGGPGYTWSDLKAELRLLVEIIQPDIVVCPHPLVDIHSDHLFTTIALEQAMRDLPRKPALFLYAVHTARAPLHPFGSAQAVVSLPPWQDDAWIADSIYSHPLDALLQRSKYFAVEAMHATRQYTEDEPDSMLQTVKSIGRKLLAFIAGTAVLPHSLLRRTARPNEIYYLASSDTLPELTQRALAARYPGDKDTIDETTSASS
ncbi:MAG TPA: PIG-L family deacetylase [Steroidobacter sp.]|nr:PIG-L family deacetylase [Steroidobacter sp.]